MNKYKYKAKSKNNRIERGIIYTEGVEDLRKILEEKKLYLLNYKVVNTNKNINKKKDLNDFVYLCTQITIMLDAGIEFDKAIYIIKNIVRKKYLKDILDKIYLDIKNGSNISDSFSKYNLFPNLFINMLQIGESTGKIEYVFRNMKEFYEKTRENKSRIKSILAYPLFLLIIGFGVLLLLIYKIIPIFQTIFESFNSEVPLITRVMINMSGHISKYGYIYFLIILIIGFSINIFRKTKKGKNIIDYLKTKIMGVNKLYLYFNTYIFSHCLSLLIISGSTLVDGLDITSKVLGNNYLETKLIDVENNVRSGMKFSDSLTKINYFSYEFIEMISIGEASGKVVDILNIMSNYYDNMYTQEINKITKRIEPIMILIIGGLLMFMLMGLFMPILGIMDSVSSRI